MSECLYRVDAPHMIAGFVTRDGVVVTAAPILKYMLRWSVAAAEASITPSRQQACWQEAETMPPQGLVATPGEKLR